MAGKVVDLSSVGMEARVENLDSVKKVVVVVKMAMIVVDFDLEVVELVDSEKMEDIDKIEQISHKDSACLVPMIEKDLRLGPRLLPRIPIWWGLKVHRVVKPLVLLPLPRSPCNKTERLDCIWIFLKDSFEPRD